MNDARQPIVIDASPFRVPDDGSFRLSSISTDDTAGLADKKAARRQFAKNRDELVRLQELMYAEGRQSLLLVLQAMDTAGKDSTIRRVTEGLNPQGCQVYSFKVPSSNELAHDFLWRVHFQVPRKGFIGIFNRSHYEDVLVVRVKSLAPANLIEKRYEHINGFERLLHDHGTRVVKVMLHISKEYQLDRLRRRLQKPDKRWKFNPGDLKEREKWDDYMAAYETMLNRCSTEYAPWHVVPAERRWFRNLLISQLLLDTMRSMNPQPPKLDYDPADYPPESLT